VLPPFVEPPNDRSALSSSKEHWPIVTCLKDSFPAVFLFAAVTILCAARHPCEYSDRAMQACDLKEKLTTPLHSSGRDGACYVKRRPPPYTTFSNLLLLNPSVVLCYPNTLFSNTLNLYSSQNVRDQVSHESNTSILTVLCILIFTVNLLNHVRHLKFILLHVWKESCADCPV
jgi:hypothetical protein